MNKLFSRLLVYATVVTLIFAMMSGLTPASQDVSYPSINRAILAHNYVGSAAEHALFANALSAAAQHTVTMPDGTVYVSTGDIPAEWLRDASAEVRPYLYLANSDPALAKLLAGVIAREAKYIALDPYANAFRKDYSVWERKYELDSLAYPIILSFTYWKTTGDSSIFTPELSHAFDRIIDLMKTEQRHGEKSDYTHRELPNGGKGSAVADTGMVWSAFRPSDDATTYGYLIPSEMMAVVALGDLAEIESAVYHDQTRAQTDLSLRLEINHGIQKFGVVDTKQFGKIYAYEVDGFGHQLLTDDANVPSLLAAPYLGYGSVDDPIYQNTRHFILSKKNPTYEEGTSAKGIGSYHTPNPHKNSSNKYWIWPLALVMQDLTSVAPQEQNDLLPMILRSDPGDHLLHESFDPDDPKQLTRQDFAWPNSLSAELVLTRELHLPFIPMGDTSDLITP